jgi:hypothetical protein
MARLGYSDQELAEVSDRLVDSIVGHGDPAAIAAKVREHVAAGADHVMVTPPIGGDSQSAWTNWNNSPRCWPRSPDQRDRDSRVRVTCSVLQLDRQPQPS